MIFFLFFPYFLVPMISFGIGVYKFLVIYKILSLFASAFIGGGGFVFWLTTWKERREGKIRFDNRLICVAHELKINFKDVGNSQNPFQTKALEKLVYDEPLVHKDPELFTKAQKCLHIALILSSSNRPKLTPGQGQGKMKDLSNFLSKFYNITVPEQDWS